MKWFYELNIIQIQKALFSLPQELTFLKISYKQVVWVESLHMFQLQSSSGVGLLQLQVRRPLLLVPLLLPSFFRTASQVCELYASCGPVSDCLYNPTTVFVVLCSNNSGFVPVY